MSVLWIEYADKLSTSVSGAEPTFFDSWNNSILPLRKLDLSNNTLRGYAPSRVRPPLQQTRRSVT